jgi:hypothetical protein
VYIVWGVRGVNTEFWRGKILGKCSLARHRRRWENTVTLTWVLGSCAVRMGSPYDWLRIARSGVFYYLSIGTCIAKSWHRYLA